MDYLRGPGEVASVKHLLGSHDHRIPSVHQLDVASRTLHGWQRIERPGIRLEPPQVTHVNLSHSSGGDLFLGRKSLHRSDVVEVVMGVNDRLDRLVRHLTKCLQSLLSHTGIRLDDFGLILQDGIPAATLALLVQGVFELIERVMLPSSLRYQNVIQR